MNCLDPMEVNDKYSHFLLDAGDYVVSSSGTIGRIAEAFLEDLPCMLNTSVIRMRPKNSSILDRRFLRYFLTSSLFQTQIESFASGSVQRNYGPTHLKMMWIVLPPLPEQRAIAHILGTLDDKIELNRRMNETLEEMARALFKSWFVDFDPVRAKMEGRWRPGESLPGLPAEYYDLFPDRLVPSELGDIPDGWEVKTLGEFASLNSESWSRNNAPQELEYVDLANTKWGVIEATQHYLWKDAPSRAKRILRSGDTIVGTVRPGNGSYSLVGTEGLTGSTGFTVVRPLHWRHRELVYLAVTDMENIERLAYRADGAAYPAVRPEVVGETEVILPDADHTVVNSFSERTAPMLDEVETNKKENIALASIRDALLPKLVSGEMRVGDAKGLIGDLA